MKGYSPKLPLILDPNSGYQLTKNAKEVVSQNLKMLILTSPGERVMDPLFGVGLYNFLFELNTQLTRVEIKERIARQVKKYMPFVTIQNIIFSETDGIDIDRNTLSVGIKYFVPSLGEMGLLRIEI
tara:strand:+ start:593 stop:970 length:378 start_codon:yes stop_codon:yes gene_type:complete